MARIAPIIWTDTPPCGTGVQMSKVYPAPQLRWLVWYGEKIVRFCESPDQAFAWYFLIQAEGPEIIDEGARPADEVFAELEREEEDASASEE